MPWFEAKPKSHGWGWHWTMDTFNPDRTKNGRRQIAAHYYPLCEPYDSGDPAVIEYHLLLMKLAGIDGVIVDWYGHEDFLDHAMIHRNIKAMFVKANQLGLRFAVCYEDQTIPRLVEAGRLAASDRVRHAQRELQSRLGNGAGSETSIHRREVSGQAQRSPAAAPVVETPPRRVRSANPRRDA